MRFIPDRCPECGEEIEGAVETLVGVAILQAIGSGNYEYEGTTKLWWDEQKTVHDKQGRVLLVCVNSHEWYAKRQEGSQ